MDLLGSALSGGERLFIPKHTHMSDELALGQREVEVSTEFTPEEINLIEANELTLASVRSLLGFTNAKMTLNALIGGVKTFLLHLAEGKKVADPKPE